MDARNAFLTGASSGIGEALALELAGRGVEVALAARRVESLEALAARIKAAGGKARVYSLDVANVRDVHETLERADDEMGGLDLVIANAGVGIPGWAGKLDWKVCGPILDVNVVGATATIVALVQRMVERKRGQLVGVSSLAGYRALPSSAMYSASKSYLSVLLEGMRIDLEGTGVSVTDIQPGFVKTPMTDKNKFDMPFLMDAPQAAVGIANAIAKKQAVYSFPLPTAIMAKSTRFIPRAVFAAAAKRMKKV